MVYARVILFGKHSTSYCIHNWSWHVIIIKITHRTNCPEVFCKKVVLRKIAKFTAKHLCLRPATLLKKRLWHRCFPVNFAKFLRLPFLQNSSKPLLLYSETFWKKKIILHDLFGKKEIIFCSLSVFQNFTQIEETQYTQI